jgi:hypothetical protein
MVLVALMASAVAVPVGAAGLPAQADAQANSSTDASADVAPGEQFAGVVGVTEAEFEGEMAERTFGVKIAQQASADAKSDVVAEQLTDVEQRIDDLEQREQRLQEARENGSITEGEFRSEMAVVAAEKKTAARLAGHGEAAASGLPADTLADRGIDVEAIATLRDRANAIGGENASEIARPIAGGNVGPTAQVEVGADGNVSVDVPGLGGSVDADSDADAGSDADADNTSVDSDTSVDADNTSVDSDTSVDADADSDNISVNAESDSDADL